jgi:thiosulfate reductase cytochrome b subunit
VASTARKLRSGLPRQRGGGAWPPPGDLVAAPAETPAPASAPVVAPASVAPMAVASTAVAPASDLRLRSGLPRVAGGRPWPEAGEARDAANFEVTDAAAAAVAPPTSVGESTAPTAAPTLAEPPPVPAAASEAASGPAIRRGLPRVAGGDPWPTSTVTPAAASTATRAPVVAPTPAAPLPAAALAPAAAPPAAAPLVPAAAAAPSAPTRPAAPRTTPTATAAATQPSTPAASGAKRYGLLTAKQWAGASVIGILAIIGAATIVVQLTRWFIGLDFMQDFLATYPGETQLPEGAPVGLPAWLGWQHFFNVFLIVLIIRSGLRVRTEKRPAAYWTPRWSKGGRGKISLNLWFHQALDILWLVNGVVFVVLLFATGQWMRVVPTSWEYIPNAVSAGLQYLSLNWPLENGWVNYNSLQVLTYFATIFIAAPLAVLTGVRMSGLWPKDAKTLNRVYPVEWARAVHFPVMLYFVAFIVVHVVLVFTTGVLRNLNHMFASQNADNWLGFWIFVASLVVIVAAWVAARPTVLAPIAGVFGKVGR